MRFVLAAAAGLLVCAPTGQKTAPPWSIPKAERPLLVAMASCKDVPCVQENYAKIRKPEVVAKIVYFSNLLRLRPRDRTAARGLLANIPATDDEYTRLIMLASNLYPGETDAQIDAVVRAYWDFNRRLAHGLVRFPDFLPAFIQYGRLAMPNHHDDYPNWAGRVCRSNPKRFLKAFRTLSEKDQQYIAKYVIQPRNCKQIAFPEAE